MSDYEEEKIKLAQKQIDEIIASGAPIVKMDIFDVLDDYVPSDRIKGKIEYTKELYLDLVNKLKEYDIEYQNLYLKTLRDSDIIDNQSMEEENPFFIALHKQFEDVFSIDILLEKLNSNSPISREEFIRIHDILLQGTSSKNKLGLRDNDLKFVGHYEENPQAKYTFENRVISYFPLKHTEIDAAINKFLNFINSGVKPNDDYDVVLLPMVCHGLIATLQLFKDGNTRYARLFQSALFHKLSNEMLNLDLPLPLVYATRQYAAYRKDYRKIIENIVINNDKEAWEDWFNFNLKRLQDGIFYNMNSLEILKYYKDKGKTI